MNYTITGNVMVGLVVGVFDDANTTSRDKALWSGWHARGAKKMFWRPNIGGASGAGPLQGSKAMVSTLKWLAEHGFKWHSCLFGKPRGGNYHWIDNHIVRATRFNSKLTDFVKKYMEVEVFDDE